MSDIPGTWFAADTKLGKRDSRKIANNTYLRRRGPDRIAVMLHSTDVYTIRQDGWVVLSTGGWDSLTTRQRINAALPMPWGVGSHRVKGDSWLYLFSHGYPIMPFANGLSVNVGTASDGGTGAVGFPVNGEIGTLYTAEQVAEIETAAEKVNEDRAAKRAARLLREHPVAREITYRADVPHTRNYGYGSPLTSPHRGHPWDCARCEAEDKAWRAIRQETLRADHEDGHAWAVTVGDATVSEPAGACPWDCPDRHAR